jgi:asparaginyl-tRNA synthetase
MQRPSSRVPIHKLLSATEANDSVLVKGWVRTRRDAKDLAFLEVKDFTTGCAVAVEGELIESPGSGQKWEVKASRVSMMGPAPVEYPLQKKRHSDEFLRTIAHLRPRTNKYGAMFRIRSRLSQAIHRFFQSRGFYWIHTPILTAADCEGAGEMFTVTTLDLEAPPRANGRVDYSNDFFGKPAKLTVSGQLSVEMFALSLGDVYTFGPTFRAENSNTSRHMAEFWMIEPEIAFANLDDDMDLAEDFVREMVRFAVEDCADDVGLFARFVDQQLLDTLDNIVSNEFVRISYGNAIEILQKAKQQFEFEPRWGADLQSEHERYLTEQHFKRPTIVHDYPKDIKAFYMRMNDDGQTVAAMDVLVPRIGELIGGSQREERYEQLLSRIKDMGFDESEYWWYLDSRRFGTAPHSGFGLGLERLLMLVTGAGTIRDVIPFPRTPKHLEF